MSRKLAVAGVPVYPSRPTGNTVQNDSFLAVTVPYGAEDETFIGMSYLRVELYVRNAANGVADLPRLQKLTDTVISVFPLAGEHYKAWRPRVVLKGDDGNGFTIWLIQAELMIINV